MEFDSLISQCIVKRKAMKTVCHAVVLPFLLLIVALGVVQPAVAAAAAEVRAADCDSSAVSGLTSSSSTSEPLPAPSSSSSVSASSTSASASAPASACHSSERPRSSTTSLVLHMPTGYIDATSLEWSFTWRRCSTRSRSGSMSSSPTTLTVSAPAETAIAASTGV